MSAGLGYPSLQNPITKSGRVVVNAKKDRISVRHRQFVTKRDAATAMMRTPLKTTGALTNRTADENYSILNHEIALHLETGAHVYHVVAPHDGSVTAITSINGWSNPEGFEGKSAVPAIVRETLGLVWLPAPHSEEAGGVTFAGIAATRAQHDSSDMAANEEDCVLQTGGMCTIYNNSTLTVRKRPQQQQKAVMRSPADEPTPLKQKTSRGEKPRRTNPNPRPPPRRWP